MAHTSTDVEGNLCIKSNCERVEAVYMPSADLWQINTELEDIETEDLMDFCVRVIEACSGDGDS